jgi:hypothetical protein
MQQQYLHLYLHHAALRSKPAEALWYVQHFCSKEAEVSIAGFLGRVHLKRLQMRKMKGRIV